MAKITQAESHVKIVQAQYDLEELKMLFRNDLENGEETVTPDVTFQVMYDAHSIITGVHIALVYKLIDTLPAADGSPSNQ